MSGTSVQIRYGYGTPQAGSLRKAELAIDLTDESLWTADENGNIVRVGHNTSDIEINIEDILDELRDRVLHNDERNVVDEGKFQIVIMDNDGTLPVNARLGYQSSAADPNSLEGSIVYVDGKAGTVSIGRDGKLIADDYYDADGNSVLDQIKDNESSIGSLEGQVNQNTGDISDLETNLGKLEGQVNANTGDISSNTGDISDLRNEFENHDHKLDDLSDVSAASPSKDELLVFNGSEWESASYDFIQTPLNFRGATNVTGAAPSADQGDLYVNDTEGAASSSWTGIAGTVVKVGNFIGYANSRWYLLGQMADIGVTSLGEGTAISIDDSKPSEPVVSVDKTETDKWYEPKFNKNSGFNKNFGKTSGTVAEGNHTHDQYLTGYTETDPTVPQHVKDITSNQISNWQTAYGWGDHSQQGYLTDLPAVINGGTY